MSSIAMSWRRAPIWVWWWSASATTNPSAGRRDRRQPAERQHGAIRGLRPSDRDRSPVRPDTMGASVSSRRARGDDPSFRFALLTGSVGWRELVDASVVESAVVSLQVTCAAALVATGIVAMIASGHAERWPLALACA